MPRFLTTSPEGFVHIQPELVDSIVDTVDVLRQQDEVRVRAMSRKSFSAVLSHKENRLVRYLYRISPQKMGIAMDEWTSVPDPSEEEFGLLPASVHTIGGNPRIIQAQFVPPVPLEAFREMQQAMRHDGLSILSGSSYRSPAYQAGIFLSHAKNNDYRLDTTLREAALPMNSEHSDLDHTAFDFMAQHIPAGQHSYNDFAATPEYAWLIRHAHFFGFELSYPEDNPQGLMFEPWHWRFVGKQKTDSE